MKDKSIFKNFIASKTDQIVGSIKSLNNVHSSVDDRTERENYISYSIVCI